MSGQSLQSRLRELKQRSLIVAVLASGGWGLAGAVSFLVLCTWADLVLDLPAAVRAMSIGASVVLALLIVGRLGWLAGAKSLPRRLHADSINRRLRGGRSSRVSTFC